MDEYRIEIRQETQFSLTGGASKTVAAADIYRCKSGRNGGRQTKGEKLGMLVADTETELLGMLGKLAVQEGDGMEGVARAFAAVKS